MKNFLVLFAFSTITLSLALFFPKSSYALTIYSNDFTSNLLNYQEFFNSCSPSINGLVCTGPTNEQYLFTFPNVTCISADFTNPTSISDSISLIDGNSFLAPNFVALRPTIDGHIGIDTANTFLGVALSSIENQTGQHNYMLCKNGNNFNGYLDGNIVVSFLEPGHFPISFLLGLSGGNTRLTNLTVTDTLPQLSPNQLPVPLLKQTDNPWQSQEYDSAQLWAPSSPTMYSWGCAVTSAAMVFQYHGITKMPDNTPLDPGSVNTWLKNQPDGFVGNGNVNWLALTRLSSLAKQSGNNPGFSFDALQFQKILGGANTQNVARLTDDLKVNPDILEEPGHFIVATGTQAATFTINDPYFPRATLNDGYSNSFLTLNRFIPSHTDLSYIMLDSSQNITFTLKDATGSAVGQQFVQQPLQDDAHLGTFAGQNENIFYLSQPINGIYQLTISGANGQLYTLKGFLYDMQGNVKPFTLSGLIDSTHPDTFRIIFSKTNQQTDSLDKLVTFDSILRDIQNLYNKGELKRDAYRNLLEETREAQRKYQKSHFKFVKKLELGEQLLYLKWHQGRSVSQAAYDILFYDFMQLIKAL